MAHYRFSARAIEGKVFSDDEVSDDDHLAFLEVDDTAIKHAPSMRTTNEIWVKRGSSPRRSARSATR